MHRKRLYQAVGSRRMRCEGILQIGNPDFGCFMGKGDNTRNGLGYDFAIRDDPTQDFLPLDKLSKTISDRVAKSLEREGLYPREALAMVKYGNSFKLIT